MIVMKKFDRPEGVSIVLIIEFYCEIGPLGLDVMNEKIFTNYQFIKNLT
jgi:hypothetical protein